MKITRNVPNGWPRHCGRKPSRMTCPSPWWTSTASDLAAWLDMHPATDCWADYHAEVRAGLGRVLAELATVKAALDAKQVAQFDTTEALVKEADALFALPLPAGCP